MPPRPSGEQSIPRSIWATPERKEEKDPPEVATYIADLASYAMSKQGGVRNASLDRAKASLERDGTVSSVQLARWTNLVLQPGGENRKTLSREVRAVLLPVTVN